MTEKPIILYIEDNLDNQRLIQRVLGKHGYEIRLVEDGPSGLSYAREATPALILVDIDIPGLNGYEVATRLRSMPHLGETPIVALTADVSPGSRERALVAGCDGYLSKPVDPVQLPEKIAEFIAGKREVVTSAVEVSMLRELNEKMVARLEQRVRDLTIAHAELQEVDRLKNRFLGSLSHELRTPLTSLYGYIDLFKRGTLGDVTELQSDALHVMQRSVDQLARQLNNLLYLQEERVSESMLSPIVLNDMIAHLIEIEHNRLTQKQLEVTLALNAIEPITVDAPAMELALSNLIDNAIKYTPEQGTITISLQQEHAGVVLKVQDTGCGIPEGDLEKIFLPFYRVHEAFTTEQPGNGVGLAVARHVIEAHGGQISAASLKNAGSTFTVVLAGNPEALKTRHVAQNG